MEYLKKKYRLIHFWKLVLIFPIDSQLEFILFIFYHVLDFLYFKMYEIKCQESFQSWLNLIAIIVRKLKVQLVHSSDFVNETSVGKFSAKITKLASSKFRTFVLAIL